MRCRKEWGTTDTGLVLQLGFLFVELVPFTLKITGYSEKNTLACRIKILPGFKVAYGDIEEYVRSL
jgi:hypothetical protein